MAVWFDNGFAHAANITAVSFGLNNVSEMLDSDAMLLREHNKAMYGYTIADQVMMDIDYTEVYGQ